MELENKELCKKCGGHCCQMGGCEYFVSDFTDLSFKALDSILKEGRVCISAIPQFGIVNRKIICTPFLTLRARNIGRDIIDLLSFETQCASLTKDGCFYDFEHRPSGGKHLIPRPNKKCSIDYDPKEKMKEWMPYQNALRKLVKKYTGKSAEVKFKEDIIDFIYTFSTIPLDNISVDRLSKLKELIEHLLLSNPDETKAAFARLKQENHKLIYTPEE